MLENEFSLVKFSRAKAYDMEADIIDIEKKFFQLKAVKNLIVFIRGVA